MATIARSSDLSMGMGLISVILGSVGVLLFFMPILGIPLGAFGMAFGAVGLVVALLGGRASLRWSAVGIVASSLALGIGVSIASAPAGFLPSTKGSALWQRKLERPYVPSPARPETVEAEEP